MGCRLTFVPRWVGGKDQSRNGWAWTATPPSTSFFLMNLFIFGCVGSSLLRVGFSSCSERGLLFVAVRGLLIAVASLVAEHGL